MAEKLQIHFKQLGSKLQNLPASKDDVVTLLTEAATALSGMDQSPTKALLESMQDLMNAIIKEEYLKHQDEQVRVLVAACTCEITRITAPEAPYDDDVLKDIFHLFVNTFKGLQDIKDPSFGRIVNILDTVAKYRSFVVMLDLECDDLVNEMFKSFFNVASDEHTEIVTAAMETIMAVLLEESEDIAEDLLLVVLSVLGRDKKDVSAAARRLCMNVIGQCAGKLEPGIKQFILSSMSGASKHHIDYHEVIYDIYCCAPQVLKKIVPNLAKELQTDKVDLRLKAVRLVGDMFAHQGSTIPKTFQPIFLEFLKRSSDSTVEVRMTVLEKVKLCLLANPFREEAPKLLGVLCDRLLDDDESIRKQVVAVVSDVASHELSSVSSDKIKLVAGRLEDKSLLVKKYTLERLSDVYRIWCLKQFDGSNLNDDYDWIPGRILKCFCEKDIGPDTVEQILFMSLFPTEFPVKDKVKKWVKLFSNFDEVEAKALEKILEQKQRLQLELHKYLSLRQAHKENDAPEQQKKAALCTQSISHCFVNTTKAEADFRLLDQSKDADNICKILTTLLDAATSSLQIRTLWDELLKIVDEKHPLYELLSSLSIKCSYAIFDKEFVKGLILETDHQKSDGNKLLTQACMNILAIIGSFSPLLLSGMEEDFAHLLEDDDEIIKEGALHVLAKAGETIHEQSGESSSSLDLILEKICLEGGRKQAKNAVHALAAITKDQGLKSLSVVYKRLVEMLEKRANLPSVLQSLGCIAQIAMPVFETQESKVVGFIRESILSCSQKTGDKAKESWDDRSELCSLKIFGIKTLVKSYLPVKDAHLRVGIDGLLKDLRNLLSFGEISKDIESSPVDKAHLKLASAKAIIRLSKHWDKKIPIDIFHLTLRTSEHVRFPEVKKLFLNKVHQYIKEKSLDPKYVCAFFVDFGSQNTIKEEENENLHDIIQMCDPQYILPYLVHALAHHPSCPKIDECKDYKAYEQIYRKLYVFFSKLARGDEDGKPGVSLRREEVILINSVVRSIKRVKDAVDTNMTKNSYAICDLCLSMTKRLARNKEDVPESVVPISLPQVLYTPLKNKELENEEDEKKEKVNEDKKEQEIKEDEKIEMTEEDKKQQEIDTEVAEGQTWLAEENALAYFESLILEANGNVPSESNEDDIMKDSETDGNDVPLGKMLKRLKAKGSKAKKIVNNGSTPAVVEPENNIDILGMLKEINSDNVDVSHKFDSSNGHGKTSSGAKLKRKGMPNDLTNVSVPKRRRSSSAKSQKRSTFLSSGFKSGPAFNVNKVEDDPQSDKVALKASTDKSSVHKKATSKTDVEPKKPVEADNNQKSGPVRKRKRRRISGLAKGTSDETPNRNIDYVGRRIRVWWPMDKAFYTGVVKSYDREKKKHEVLYDDGDVEVLHLDKERWEFVENEKPKQAKKRLSNSPPSKGGSSKKRIKSSGSSKKTKELADISPSSTIRGKRTPRKNLKQGQKGVSQRAEYLKIKKSKDLDTSMDEAEPETEPEVEVKPTTVSKDDSLDTGEGKTSSRHDESSEGEEDSEKVQKSSPGKKQVKDAESSSSDTASSQEIEADSKKETEDADINPSDVSHKEEGENDNADSGGNGEHESTDAQTPDDRKGSTADESDDAEFLDDEPLGVWKSRVGKSVKGK